MHTAPFLSSRRRSGWINRILRSASDLAGILVRHWGRCPLSLRRKDPRLTCWSITRASLSSRRPKQPSNKIRRLCLSWITIFEFLATFQTTIMIMKTIITLRPISICLTASRMRVPRVSLLFRKSARHQTQSSRSKAPNFPYKFTKPWIFSQETRKASSKRLAAKLRNPSVVARTRNWSVWARRPSRWDLSNLCLPCAASRIDPVRGGNPSEGIPCLYKLFKIRMRSAKEIRISW